MPYQAPRGTKDILPNETSLWQSVERAARGLFSIYNYKEIRTPIIEDVSLFKRSLGNTADIVNKQMFTIKKGSDVLVLRPEATASIARAYLEHSLGYNLKLNKLFYIGPMFRAERPQRGRLRQFHHIGAEAIGSSSPFLDIEIIDLVDNLLKKIPIKDHTILINSLGCSSDRKKFALLLQKKLSKNKKLLCNDCKDRLSRNVFRVLDCKKESCREIMNSLGLDHSYLCGECKQHFDIVVEGLKQSRLNFKIEKMLVRGLDYYSRTVFEITHPGLGAQDALGAGGRYDQLFKELANKEIGGVGFAIGVERVLLVKEKNEVKPKFDCCIVTLGEKASFKGLELLRMLRESGIECDLGFSEGSLKSKLNEANKIGTRFSIIIGDNELKKEEAIVKNMEEGKQEEVHFSKIVDYIRSCLC